MRACSSVIWSCARAFVGKKVEGAGAGVGEDRLEDGQVVAEGLAGRGRRYDHDAFAAEGGLDRLRLVGVEGLDPAPSERFDQTGIGRGGERGVAGFAALDFVPGDKARVVVDVSGELGIVSEGMQGLFKGHRASLRAWWPEQMYGP
jgi:hypothetical protein